MCSSDLVGNVRGMDGILLTDNEEEMRQALERLYRDREELAERGKRLRTYMLGRKCRIEDKIDWLEKELKCLVAEE